MMGHMVGMALLVLLLVGVVVVATSSKGHVLIRKNIVIPTRIVGLDVGV